MRIRRAATDAPMARYFAESARAAADRLES